MAIDKITPDLPSEEDQIDNVSLPSDADENVDEDNIKIRPTFGKGKGDPVKPTDKEDVTPPKTPEPGKTREADPLERNKVDPNRLAASREAFGKNARKVGQGIDRMRQAGAVAGQVANDPAGAAKEIVGDKIKDEAKAKIGQAAGSAFKKSGQAIAKLGKAAGKAIAQGAKAIGTWLVGLLGPWGVAILAVIIIVGIAVAILKPDNVASDIQPPDTSKPGIVDAIDRLSALAGDPTALGKLIREQTSSLISDLEKAKIDSAKAPLKTDIEAEINRATALIERIRAGGSSTTTEQQTQMINSVIYSMQRVSALYRGMSIVSAAELVTKANAEIAAAGTWVYSENQDPKSTTKPMRDGTNQINNKKGCNSSGFIVYLLKGDNSKCAQCVTPTLDKLAATFSLLRAVNQQNTEQSVAYQKGDILVAKLANKAALEGFVVLETGQTGDATSTRVAYCSPDGPKTASLSDIISSTSKRTVTSLIRFINEDRSDVGATGGTL